MKKLLFVNACVNRTTSRSLKLARGVIEAIQRKEPFQVTEVILEEENLAPLTTETLNARQALEQKGEFDNRVFAFARQFRDADRIVIAAPLLGFQLPSLAENVHRAHRHSGDQLPLQRAWAHWTLQGRQAHLCHHSRRHASR